MASVAVVSPSRQLARVLLRQQGQHVHYFQSLYRTTRTNTPAIAARSFSNSWSNNTPNQKKKDNKKKKKQFQPAPAREGRIVSFQQDGKSKSGQPKLCTGCGVEVTKGGGSGMVAGDEAVGDGTSKAQQKKSRYLDVLDQGGTSGFLCQRCKALRGGHIWKAYDALRDVSPEVFVKQLSYIVNRRKFALCITVVDATDPEHSAPKVLRKAVGKVPCILVINKVDLLPRMDRYVQNALRSQISKIMHTNFIATFAVSATTGRGVLDLAEYVLSELRGRDVFVAGAANVGKSTLVQTLTTQIADSLQATMRNHKAKKRLRKLDSLSVTCSHLPGTTLQAVRVPCFSKPGHALWDTPGLINAKAIQYSLFPSHLMEPLTRPEAMVDSELFEGRVRKGQSILIEANWTDDDDGEANDDNRNDTTKKDNKTEPFVLGRIDVVDVEDALFARTFLHPSLRVRIVDTRDAPDRATIPSSYIETIHRSMNISNANVNAKNFSKRLRPYTQKHNPEGKYSPRDEYWADHAGKFFMDVTFASLGWVCFSGKQFAVVPHCVEGSVFSNRKALYRGSQENRLDDEGDVYEEYVDEEESRRRLKEAMSRGRHQKESTSEHDGWDEFDDDFY